MTPSGIDYNILWEYLIYNKTSQVCISSVSGKILLVTPNISNQFLEDTSNPNLQAEKTLYHKYIYALIVKAHEMHMCLYDILLFLSSVPLFILIF